MADDFSPLENMIYNGRGITVGMTPSKSVFVGYTLTERSSSSQARELVQGERTKTIRTNVTDPKQLAEGSPALLLYPAIVPHEKSIVASNGAQTKLLYSALRRAALEHSHPTPFGVILDAFKEPQWEYDQKDGRWIDITTYEPDDPNFTPRISACAMETDAVFDIVLRKEDGRASRRHREVILLPGIARIITTYKGGNESPLLPFTEEPFEVRISSNRAPDLVENLYAAIKGGANPGDNYRVSAAVMLRDEGGNLETAIINRSERGD